VKQIRRLENNGQTDDDGIPAALCTWGLLSLQQKRVPGIYLGDKAREADDLTAIFERTV
jgi:hypothetical protein